MPDYLIKRSGLTARAVQPAGIVQVAAYTDASAVILQNQLAAQAIKLGAANSVTDFADGRCMWIAPGRWLLVIETQMQLQGIQRLLSNNGSEYAVVDLSRARNVVHLGGADASDWLAQYCSLDFHHKQFRAGMVQASRLQGINVLLHRIDIEAFLLFLPRSFSVNMFRE